MSPDRQLLAFRHVTCTYGGPPAVEDVDIVVNAGEFLGVVGPSGSGKTTVLRAMIGALAPVHGTIERADGMRLGYVPQVETVDWNFPVTVSEVVTMSLPRARFGVSAAASERARVAGVLERLGLDGLGARHIRELSGGQQQRVFLARALVQRPDLLVLDEPTSGVDVRTRHEVLHVLADLNDEGIAIVLTTHDINGLAAHLPRLICFNRTVVADGSPDEVLHPYVLERTYGAPMEVLRHGGMPVVLEHDVAELHARGCEDDPHEPAERPGVAVMLGVDLLEPFQYGFFRNGIVVATLAGALCGLVGVYVVLRSMSYIGHGLSHAVFGGAAISAVMGVNYFLGAGLWGLLSGLMIGRVSSRRVIGADAAIGVVTTASFAIGLAILARSGQASRGIDAVLFGNVLGVFVRDIVAVALVGALVVVMIVVLYRQLLFVTFDPEVARVSGVRVQLMEGLLMLALAGTILVTVRVVGALLISALLVLPATSARMLTNSFGRMLWLSPLLGALFGAVGMYISWYADVPSGAVIILVGTAVFAVVYLAAGAARRRRVAGLDDHGPTGPPRVLETV